METKFDKFMNWAVFPLILTAIAALIFGWGPLLWAIVRWYDYWWRGTLIP